MFWQFSLTVTLRARALLSVLNATRQQRHRSLAEPWRAWALGPTLAALRRLSSQLTGIIQFYSTVTVNRIQKPHFRLTKLSFSIGTESTESTNQLVRIPFFYHDSFAESRSYTSKSCSFSWGDFLNSKDSKKFESFSKVLKSLGLCDYLQRFAIFRLATNRLDSLRNSPIAVIVWKVFLVSFKILISKLGC